MSLRAYHVPTHPRPVPIYLPPDASPRTTADELDVLRLALPEWLCLGERWAAWRYEWDPHRADWGKVPLDALSLGRYARSTDPRTCTSLAHAVAFRRRYGADGLLRLLVEGEEVLAIDLDHVRDAATGQLSPLARDTLARLPGEYAEISPSACGLHLYLRQPFPEPGRTGRRRGQVEVYAANRFMTCTARVLRLDEPHALARAAFRRWYHDHFPPPPERAVAPRASDRAHGSVPSHLADDEVVERARRGRNADRFEALWRGDTSRYDDDHSRADAALTAILWFWSGDASQVDRLFRRSGLYRSKWDSPRNGGTYGTRTIAYTQGSGGGR